MTVSDIIQELRDLLQEPETTGRFSDAELTRYIEAGARRVATDLKLLLDEGTATVTAGSLQVSLPADYVAFYEWLETPPELTEIVGQKVILAAVEIADVTLKFRYFRLPADVTEIPDRYREGVVYAAHMLALEADLDPRQERAEVRYARWLGLAMRQEAAATYRAVSRIKSSRR